MNDKSIFERSIFNAKYSIFMKGKTDVYLSFYYELLPMNHQLLINNT